MPHQLAILEDDVRRIAAMRAVLDRILLQAVFFDNAHSMIDWLPAHLADLRLISLDHDLPIVRSAAGELVDYGDGRLVARWLAQIEPTAPIIVHTSNSIAGDQMIEILRAGTWPVERVFPREDVEWITTGWRETIERLIRQGWLA